MRKTLFALVGSFLLLGAADVWADEKAEEAKKKQEAVDDIKKDPAGAIYDVRKDASAATVKGDSAWMMTSTGLVMLMVPGLALFYGGMVRRKNVLATMMQSMVALSVVGVYWMAIGYALAFGDPWIKLSSGSSIIGFSPELVFLHGVNPTHQMPGSNIPVYLHMLFQGMFAIITPALISGAVAERIRFKPYCIFLILWVTFVYCPLAHCVWAMDWNWANTLAAVADQNATTLAASGKKFVGVLGEMGALDFAGGTVVHIAAGFSALAAILVLRRRTGYPEHAIHPNSMVLTLTGAGLLWFGWFGFNGGSAGGSGELAVSAFAATQAAAAAAGLSWMLAEWFHRGKPTALGLASGIVAGLVTVTPASGFIFPWAGLVIGLISGIVCYAAVSFKPLLKYDDSLDAFGVHGVGGFLGAVLTGFFCSKIVNPVPPDGLGNDGLFYGNPAQVGIQLAAALASAALAFGLSLLLIKLVDVLIGFSSSVAEEIEGLDRTEHGETGFDFGLAMDSAPISDDVEPRAANVPPPHGKRFQVVLEGTSPPELVKAWADLCQPSPDVPATFKTVYPFLTTVLGNRFQFRGGDPTAMRDSLQQLLQQRLQKPIQARVETSNGINGSAIH